MRLPVALLLGPTAGGKSALAVLAARRLECEIVSVDSALVYRGLDIGADKPSRAERAGVPHHLIDIRAPDTPYSAGEFRADALRLIAEIHARGRLPLLVGGTLLYFRALEHGIGALPAADPALRATLEAQAARDGWPALHRRLAAVDAVAAARILPGDRQRIARALEVHARTGRSLTELHARPGEEPLAARYRVLRMVLAPPDRGTLHAAIAARVDAMFAAGFVDEVRALAARGLQPTAPAARAVGYRQILEALRAGRDPEDTRATVVAATRALARRQLTWLRGEPSGEWFNPTHPDTSARVLAYLAQAAATIHVGVASDYRRH